MILICYLSKLLGGKNGGGNGYLTPLSNLVFFKKKSVLTKLNVAETKSI